MNNYDTKTWVWEAQINALKSELEVQAAENRKLRAALGFARGAARLALAKASTTALGDFAVSALEAIETNADAALEGKHD